MKPIIGITTARTDSRYELDPSYVSAVLNAGGAPVLLPFVDDPGQLTPIIGCLNGMIIPGGPGIEEQSFGPWPDELDKVCQIRWSSDVHWLDSADAQDLPVLGICYGMQLMNVRAGGTLYSDVERQHPGAFAHGTDRGATTHRMGTVAGTHLARILRSHTLEVNSRHLQAVDRPGHGLRVSAWSADGVVEAIESLDGQRIGVQFHPERMNLRPLFRHLVQQAAAR